MSDEPEAGVARKHLVEAEDVVAGICDLLWALLNAKKFIANRQEPRQDSRTLT